MKLRINDSPYISVRMLLYTLDDPFGEYYDIIYIDYDNITKGEVIIGSIPKNDKFTKLI